jgi:hypothetical protein
LLNKNDIEESPDEDDNLDESKQDICTVVEMNQYTEKMKVRLLAICRTIRTTSSLSLSVIFNIFLNESTPLKAFLDS